MGQRHSTYQRYGRPILFATAGLAMAGWIAYLVTQEITPASQPTLPTGINDHLPPHSTPQTPESQAAYTVPPDHPRYLTIPAIGITANVVGVGVTRSHTIDTPKTAWDVGWYTASAIPGAAGTVFIDGHVNDTFGTPGIFAGLTTLSIGDTIIVERGDGQRFTYNVAEKTQFPASSVDMQRLLQPLSGHASGLTLVTCGGSYDRRTGTFSDRIIIFATPR